MTDIESTSEHQSRKDSAPARILGPQGIPNEGFMSEQHFSDKAADLVVENGRTSESPTPLVEPAPLRYQSNVPNRYRKRDTEMSLADRETLRQERRQKARETRRTRRTVKLQEQKYEETHEKVDVSTDSDASSIDENYDVVSLAESIEETITWRGRMQAVLHNHWLHLVIVILVALDAFIVIFELLLDIGAFNNRLCMGEGPIGQAQFCHYQFPLNCAPHAKLILDRVNISASPGHGAEDLCFCGYKEGLYVCLQANEVSGVNPALVLHGFSLAILTLFMLEIMIKIIAFRLKYFTHKFEVFDGVVVCISWTLDIASIAQEEAFEAAALLILLRLWRVIRIVNGAVLTSKNQSDSQLKKAKQEGRKVIHALHKAQDRMDEFEDENIKLKHEVQVLKAAPPRYKSLKTNSDDSEGEEDTRV